MLISKTLLLEARIQNGLARVGLTRSTRTVLHMLA